MDTLSNSVRYIKNGRGGCWWPEAKAKNQLHAGWSEIPPNLIEQSDFSAIKAKIDQHWSERNPGVATQDFNALHTLLDGPSQHVWITYEDGSLWWCTVGDAATVNPEGESQEQGHFWLTCERPWSNRSLGGRVLTITDLPGDVTLTQGFRGTVGKPKHQDQILRVLRDERDPDVIACSKARGAYQEAIRAIVSRLSWKDFELLVNLVLDRSGWVRLSRLGGPMKSIDLDVANWAIAERAFVQVKGVAGQRELDRSVDDFQRSPQYNRMIFAVHTPEGKLEVSSSASVHVWQAEEIADLVVRLGLGDWVENRLA